MNSVNEITAAQIRKMRSEFERALASVRDSVRIADLERLIATNDIDGVITLLAKHGVWFNFKICQVLK